MEVTGIFFNYIVGVCMNLDITFSDSAFSVIRDIFNLDESYMASFRDNLTFGPVYAIYDLEQWLQQRDAIWASTEEYPPFSFRNYSNDFYAVTSRLTQADNIVLWLDESLQTQLAACCLLAICRLLNISYQRISLRCYYLSGEGNEEPGFIVRPAENAPLQQFCISKALTEPEWGYRLQCWDAYTCSTPEKLLNIIASGTGACPVMLNALKVLKNRFPAYRSGLTIWDEQVLKAASLYGPEIKAARVIGYALYPARNGVDLVTDSYIYDRILKLGCNSLEAPLLKLNVENIPVNFCTVAITGAGTAALREECNTINMNGFSDWIGGIELNTASGGIWLRHSDGSIQYTQKI